MAARRNFSTLVAIVGFLTAVSFATDPPAPRGSQLRDWKLQSACEVKASGESISTAGFATSGWHSVEVPSTVVGGLVADHSLPDPFFGDNITKLPGYVAKYDFSNFDIPSDSPYKCSWWYRTEFPTPAQAQGSTQWLHFDGINYRANIWLNGKRLADSKQIVGPFRAYEFNVTNALAEQPNVLAIEISAPEGNDLGITWWDWSPTPPDKDMGLWKNVYLSGNGPVSLRDPFVASKLSPSLKSANVMMQIEARNDSTNAIKGTLRAEMDGTTFEQPVELAVGEKKVVRFTPERYPKLKVNDPKIWWPYQMGTPALHKAAFTFESGRATSDKASVRFGIREITSELDANKNI